MSRASRLTMIPLAALSASLLLPQVTYGRFSAATPSSTAASATGYMLKFCILIVCVSSWIEWTCYCNF